jgi:hypothetical protein
LKDALVTRLLARVMDWGPEEVARERPRLQALAAYKYDGYEQFSPAVRFIGHLGDWLEQFDRGEERRIAYEFVLRDLVFVTDAELRHLVSMAYPTTIRPLLLRGAALADGIDPFHVSRIAASPTFRGRLTRTLFLALSDGARIDLFRRLGAEYGLIHDQIWVTYDLARGRVAEFLSKLRERTHREDDRFTHVVLLDDFSASGLSYLRRNKEGKLKGKVATFYEQLQSEHNDLVSADAEISVILYLATPTALAGINSLGMEMVGGTGFLFRARAVHELVNAPHLVPGGDMPVLKLVEQDRYYDDRAESSSTRVGGFNGSVRYGFNQNGLTLVLAHNTPNNSISLLWSQTSKVTALFERVSRHRDESDESGNSESDSTAGTNTKSVMADSNRAPEPSP